MTTNATPSVEILNLTTAQTQPHWSRLAHGHTWIFNGQPIDTSTLPDTVDQNTFETCFLNHINVIQLRQGRDVLGRLPPVLRQLFLQVNAQAFHASKLYDLVVPYCKNLADARGLTPSDFVPLPHDLQIWVKTSLPKKEETPEYAITWESGSNSLVLKTRVAQLQYQETVTGLSNFLCITRAMEFSWQNDRQLQCKDIDEHNHLPQWHNQLRLVASIEDSLKDTRARWNRGQLPSLPDNDKCIRSLRSSHSGQSIEETFFRYPNSASESFICIAPEIPPDCKFDEDPNQPGNLIAKVTVVPLLYTDKAHDTYETLEVTYIYHYRAEQSQWIPDKAPLIYAYSNDYIRGEWWLAIGCLLPAGGLELSFPQLLPFSGAFIILGCIFIVRARLGDTDSISLPPLDALNHLTSETLMPSPAISPPPSPPPPSGRPKNSTLPPASPSPATPP